MILQTPVVGLDATTAVNNENERAINVNPCAPASQQGTRLITPKHKVKNGFTHGAAKPNSNGTVGRSNGVISVSRENEKRVRSEIIAGIIQRVGKFEIVWYPTFIILGLLCLILIPIFTTMSAIDVLLLCFSVTSLWFSMFANNLVARGYRIGLLLSTISMCFYVVVCILQHVWGEVIINLALYIPLEIMGFFKWKNSAGDSGKISAVKKMTTKDLAIYLPSLAGLTAAIWAILEFGIKQKFAIFNAISIAACVIGNIVRNKKYLETWYIYMTSNTAAIILWALTIFASGDGLTLVVLPSMLSFMATLSNNFNGIVIWSTLYRNENKNGGVYLALRPVNINKVAKIKRMYRNMICKETEKVEKAKADFAQEN